LVEKMHNYRHFFVKKLNENSHQISLMLAFRRVFLTLGKDNTLLKRLKGQ